MPSPDPARNTSKLVIARNQDNRPQRGAALCGPLRLGEDPDDGTSRSIAAAPIPVSDFLWSDLPPGPAAQELAAPSLPRFVTISALAMALGVNERTIRRGIQKGLIRTAPLGGRLVRIPMHEVDRLIAGEPLPAPEDSK